MNFYLRLERLWVYGGFLAALMLLALTPLLSAGWDVAVLAVWLILPAYMIHQYEEHDDNRFARFLNEHMGRGREILTPRALFVINMGGVWVLNVLVMWLVVTRDPGWGLISVYAASFNAVLHLGQAIRMRRYNPGLVTALVVLLPLSVWAGWVIHAAVVVRATQELVAIGVAVGLHVAIFVFAYFRMKQQRVR